MFHQTPPHAAVAPADRNSRMPASNTNHDNSILPEMLRESELADRWRVSTRTLQRWRAENFGPRFTRIGGSIRYVVADVLDYELRHRDEGASE
jgi:hypothetical protein